MSSSPDYGDGEEEEEAVASGSPTESKNPFDKFKVNAAGDLRSVTSGRLVQDDTQSAEALSPTRSAQDRLATAVTPGSSEHLQREAEEARAVADFAESAAVASKEGLRQRRQLRADKIAQLEAYELADQRADQELHAKYVVLALKAAELEEEQQAKARMQDERPQLARSPICLVASPEMDRRAMPTGPIS